MNFQIREATLGDYSELMRLYEELVEQPGRYSLGGEDSFQAVLGDREAKVLVAQVDQALIGFAAFSRRSVVVVRQ
jgi:L-amino acid N-acyltransferase YncA